MMKLYNWHFQKEKKKIENNGFIIIIKNNN